MPVTALEVFYQKHYCTVAVSLYTYRLHPSVVLKKPFKFSRKDRTMNLSVNSFKGYSNVINDK